MPCSKQMGASRRHALSRLFSPSVIREISSKSKFDLFRLHLIDTGLFQRTSTLTDVGEAFDQAFYILRSPGIRNEYVYRDAVVQKVLMGRHSLRTATMLSEFRVDSNKADIVVLNGTSTVYEIKSERDSLSRLASQVESYTRVFAKVNVIASPCHIDSIAEIVPEHVGILRLSDRYQISTVRESKMTPEKLSSEAIVESVRTEEARLMLLSMGIPIPNLPNTQMGKAIRQASAELNGLSTHNAMLSVLRQTRSLASRESALKTLPVSLRAAALSLGLSVSEMNQLCEAVHTPLNSVFHWS